jgi:uncharacterized protein YtpQ (UPF0354 family)
VQVMNATFMPVVVSAGDLGYSDHHVFDVLFDDLLVGYSIGRPHGGRLMTWDEFQRLRITRRELRRRAADYLDWSVRNVAIHGQPPVLMASFEGIESSLLLAVEFWDGLEAAVPGSLVIGAPARDALFVTGSRSRTGVERIRRAIDRIYLAGGRHLVTPAMLTWRGGRWHRF